MRGWSSPAPGVAAMSDGEAACVIEAYRHMCFNRGSAWARERDIEQGVQRPPAPERPEGLSDGDTEAEDTDA
eukprot:1610902-Alexandrium_andersonii.AAC.1